MTRIRRLFSLLLASLMLVALAPTSALGKEVVDGPITQDTTWTQANSPYVLAEDVVVEDGVTLTIEPGVSVQGTTSANLIILGQLIADGTQEDRIYFTRRPDQSRWGGVVVATDPAAADQTSITHAFLINAQDALELFLSAPHLSDLKFFNNITAVEIRSPDDIPVALTDSLLRANRVAIKGNANSRIDITGNDFYNNKITIIAGPRRIYACGFTTGRWEIHKNDLPRGLRQADWGSYDVRTPEGSGDLNYEVDARNNWWGTTDKQEIGGRFTDEIACCPEDVLEEVVWKPVAESAFTEWEPYRTFSPPYNSGHGDPAYILSIDNLRHGECVHPSDARSRIAGRATPAIGNAPKVVEVALRKRFSSVNCRWWNAEKDRMADGRCGKGIWNRVRVQEDHDWVLQLDGPLSPGKYTAFVRPVGGNEGCSDAGRECVRFTQL